ncbi:19206_t:CDS:2 [Dentiscutata erythropus]|uniref:19206_t:CDS:1 n=1 Tax=Dentiscutata erythropus TaxID=1348616 RepID=A0A9N9JZ27_9GLOM|nr:19206_t:CDS:2 [Dentiscutata erythropus]
MSSKSTMSDLESKLQSLRTTLNAVYSHAGNMLEIRMKQGQRVQNRQPTTLAPSKEDSERLQNLKTQFNEICDELYLNLVDPKPFLSIERSYENFCLHIN